MRTDLVLSPFGADPRAMIELAVAADAAFDGVYTYDHFSGVVAGQRWSRDPFVVLGAIATATTQLRLGVLVANVFNRHPVQLASAVNSLQALAPGRVICGVGSGAAPGSAFAAEYDLIDRPIASTQQRRAALVAAIAELRAVWVDDAVAVVDGSAAPPVIVGASSLAAATLAGTHADGVNLRRTDDDRLAAQVAAARDAAAGRRFEVSVFDRFDAGHRLGGEVAPLEALGVDRRTLWVVPPYPVDAVVEVGRRLGEPA